MQPKTLSASALTTWEECPAKYAATYIARAPEYGKKLAAAVGSVCHYALEHFVDEVYLQGIRPWNDKARLVELVKEGYRSILNSADYTAEEYKDALNLVKKWHERTDLTGRTVLSVERKVQYPLPALSGEIPLTYIMDRLDVTAPAADGSVELHCVDYKSQRIAESFDDLENKLQALIYALCIYLQYGQQYVISSVWVHLDLLRHDKTVGVEFSWEQCLETWYWLLEQADLIRAMDADTAPEILGPGCAYCPRRSACKTLNAHNSVGGVVGELDLDELVRQRNNVTGQLKGLRNLAGELEDLIAARMKDQDVPKLSVDGVSVSWGTGRGRRVIDSSRAAAILGPEITGQNASLGITKIDELINSGTLSSDQIDQLKSLITMQYPAAGPQYRKASTPRKASNRP